MPKRILKGIWKAAHGPAWWGVFFGLVALLTQAIPWAWNLATDPADLQLDSPSASVVSDYAVFSVRVENHTSRRIYIDTVTARPLRGPHQISSTLCPDANHRDGGIPPQDAALYSLNRNVGRGILAPYRRPTEVEFTVTPKVGDPVDTRATSRYQPGYEETTFTLEQQEC